MLHDKMFCHYLHEQLVHLQLVKFKKHPVKQPKYGDIITELFMINTYEWFLRHMMSSYGYL